MTSLLAPAQKIWLRFGFNEIGPLLSFLGVAMFGWAFFALADEMREGETMSLDRSILFALRSPQNPADPLGPGWLEEAARDITALGGDTVLTIVTASAIICLLMAGKRGAALLVFLAVDGGLLLSTLLKAGFDRPRPDLVPHAVQVYTASFPSGHAMLSAIAYLTLGAVFARMMPRRRLKAFIIGLAVFLTLIIGMSRVYLGVHWPSDVVGGWCIGAAWASLCWFITLQLQRRGAVERSGDPISGSA